MLECSAMLSLQGSFHDSCQFPQEVCSDHATARQEIGTVDGVSAHAERSACGVANSAALFTDGFAGSTHNVHLSGSVANSELLKANSLGGVPAYDPETVFHETQNQRLQMSRGSSEFKWLKHAQTLSNFLDGDGSVMSPSFQVFVLLLLKIWSKCLNVPLCFGDTCKNMWCGNSLQGSFHDSCQVPQEVCPDDATARQGNWDIKGPAVDGISAYAERSGHGVANSAAIFADGLDGPGTADNMHLSNCVANPGFLKGKGVGGARAYYPETNCRHLPSESNPSACSGQRRVAVQRESLGGIDGSQHETEGGIYSASHGMQMAAGFGFQSDLSPGCGVFQGHNALGENSSSPLLMSWLLLFNPFWVQVLSCSFYFAMFFFCHLQVVSMFQKWVPFIITQVAMPCTLRKTTELPVSGRLERVVFRTSVLPTLGPWLYTVTVVYSIS